ncbi:MAG: carboxypeptidase-like regulatory domain-containing protein [bacterium]|nr:carboxypeptidase-like regulatory domain-containing protein [bacterium]
MRYFKILALFVTLTIIGLGANGGCGCPGPVSLGLGKITGYVASSVLVTTRIPGATITAVGGGKTYTTVTDEQGNYTLLVPAGTYNVSASKDTFNTKTESGVSVTADGTKTVNFSLTTGIGETPEISISDIAIITITYPNQFDIRGLSLDKNLKLDIKSLLKLYPPTIKTDGSDYKSAFIIEASFAPSPPLGAKGSRIYVGTSSNGPFILKSLGPGVITSMPVSTAFNSVDTLVPNTTYYIYPSLYGTWGESIAEEYMEVSTPEKLELINPGNNSVVFPGDQVTFEWTSLGEGWDYNGEIRKETGDYVGSFSTNDSSYTAFVPQEAEVGNYIWRIIGSRFSGGEPAGLSKPDGSSYRQISISYPRRLIIGSEPAE